MPRQTGFVRLEAEALRTAQHGALLHGVSLHDYLNTIVRRWMVVTNATLLSRSQGKTLADLNPQTK